MAYNEEILLQFMIDHYRSRFPNCHIVVNDNESTDKTKEIALNNNCEVLTYSTNSLVDDIKLRDLKNNCWKSAQTDWVLVCDVDELLDINEKDLILEDQLGSTIIKSEGYTMVNMDDNYDFKNIKHGIRDTQYDKFFLFNKKAILDINYECGAHKANPIGSIKFSNIAYKLYHWRFIHPDLTIIRNKLTAPRLSAVNLQTGMGAYVLESEETSYKAFKDIRTRVKKIL